LLHARTGDSRLRLLLLPLLGFPWLVGAAGGIGWQFRESAAWVAEQVFSAAGFSMVREGTRLSIQGERLGVEAACAGLGSLQAMLLAGAAAASMELGQSRRFWFCLPFLFAAAWLANTVRVLLICAAALTAGHEFASSSFHGLIGWLVLTATFAGCLAFFRTWAAPPVRRTIISPAIQPS
jgi:exosortase/archaeosortase family protein